MLHQEADLNNNRFAVGQGSAEQLESQVAVGGICVACEEDPRSKVDMICQYTPCSSWKMVNFRPAGGSFSDKRPTRKTWASGAEIQKCPVLGRNVESYFLLKKSLLKNQTTDFDVFPHQPGFRHFSSAEFKSTVFSHLRTCQWLNGTVPSRPSWQCRRFQTAHFITKSQRRRRPGGSSRPHQFSSPAGWPSFWKRCSLTHCYTSSRQLQRNNLPVYKLWHCRRSRFPSSSKCSTTNHWKLENQEPATNWRSTKTHHRSSWQIGEPS